MTITNISLVSTKVTRQCPEDDGHLVLGLVSDEVSQGAHLTRLRGRCGSSHVKLHLLPGAEVVLVAPVLVAGGVEEDEAEDVDVPKSVDARHETLGKEMTGYRLTGGVFLHSKRT